LRKKKVNFGLSDGKHTSGPEGRIDLIAFMPEINLRPTLKLSFSASCKAVPFYRTPGEGSSTLGTKIPAIR
jgi:hypothetical protein